MLFPAGRARIRLRPGPPHRSQRKVSIGRGFSSLGERAIKGLDLGGVQVVRGLREVPVRHVFAKFLGTRGFHPGPEIQGRYLGMGIENIYRLPAVAKQR